MNGKVKVVATNGSIVNASSNNPDFGYVRVEQETTSFEGGFINKKTRSALINGPVEDLKQLFTHEGQELPGKIQVVESLEPLNSDPEYAARDIKKAGSGDDAPACAVDGKPIYRIQQYTEMSSAEDTLIEHTNVEEVRAYAAAQREAQEEAEL